LKTPIIGRWAKGAVSSWVDMLAGLSGVYIFSMPPCFWANAVPPAEIAISNALAATAARRFSIISLSPLVSEYYRKDIVAPTKSGGPGQLLKSWSPRFPLSRE
jgi:hypothetical protein